MIDIDDQHICSMPNCKQVSKIKITAKKAIYLCDECMKNLYVEIGKGIIPSSIRPIFKKDKKQERYYE